MFMIRKAQADVNSPGYTFIAFAPGDGWMPATPLVISHAACGGLAPENTLAGVRAALDLGVDAIEIDVRSTADRVPVLMHDPTVDRTTNGAGLVSAMPLEQLKVLDAGGAAHEGRYAGERVPALTEVADLIDGRCCLIVEIKQPGIEALVVDVLRNARSIPWSMVWSFDIESVAEFRRIEPSLPAVLLLSAFTTNPLQSLDSVVSRNLSGIAAHSSRVDARLPRAVHLRGLVIYAWTADDAEEQIRLRDCGVDGLVSNRPDLLIRALRQ
jgi:glycerophosphoryl diester phosphodiesterase